MKKILLILPSSTYRASDFMAAASRLNVEIIVASDHRQALAPLVPDTTIALNFHKKESMIEKASAFARRHPFDAVIGVDDVSAYVAAVIAEALEIPHNPAEALAAARNKYLMRRKLSAAGLNTPQCQLLKWKKKNRPRNLLEADQINYPVVLKPVFLSGSRGVIRANNCDEFLSAFSTIGNLVQASEVRSLSFGKEANYILIEDYIPGWEVAVEAILINKEFKSLAIFDKPDPLEGPYFVETIYITPSRLPGYVQREVLHTAHQAALALGLENGPIHAELRINEKGVWPVEIAGRSIGGLCSHVLRFDDNITLEELILRQALGENIRAIQRERQAAGVMMIPIPREGYLKRVTGVEIAQRIPGIEDILITLPAGSPVLPMPWGSRYLGFIFARGDSPEGVEEAIRSAHKTLDILIEDNSH